MLCCLSNRSRLCVSVSVLCVMFYVSLFRLVGGAPGFCVMFTVSLFLCYMFYVFCVVLVVSVYFPFSILSQLFYMFIICVSFCA